MRFLLVSLPLLCVTPAMAEVTHAIESRFGVAYVADPSNPGGRTRALYEGRYTSTFTHQSDSGLRFRFDVGIAVGNYDSRDPVYPLRPRNGAGFGGE